MAAAFVAKAIASDKVVVFSKSYCPFCVKAKQAIKAAMGAAFTFTVVELEDNPDCQAIQDALSNVTGGRSVPRVFVNGKFIGGGDDTASKAASGELKTLIEA
eukprot:gene7500-646_t